jgi:hypothetical protein
MRPQREPSAANPTADAQIFPSILARYQPDFTLTEIIEILLVVEPFGLVLLF